MGATKLLILENSLGQKVRTFAAHSEFLNLVYINDTRRVEAYATLTKLDADKVSYKLIQKIEVKKMSADGLVLKNLGTIRPLTDSAVNSPSYELPEQQDEENLKVLLKNTTIAHVAAVFLLIMAGWAWTTFFNKEKEEQLVTIVLPQPEIPKPKAPVQTVKMSETKIKPTKKIVKKIVQKKSPVKAYKTRTAKAVDIQRVGALAALGGLKTGSKGAEGLDMNSMKNIRSAGTGNGGGGIGSAGRGGIKGFIPGSGLIAGSAGSGGKATGAGGYGTRGSGGGKAGYGKIAIVGGASAVSLPLDDEATVDGGLDRDQIIAVINRNRGQIVYCYERGLQSQPNIGGRVAVSFIIGPNGRINTANVAQSSLASKTVENCMLSKMKTWQFPRPVGNVNVDVLYPFELMRVSSR